MSEYVPKRVRFQPAKQTKRQKNKKHEDKRTKAKQAQRQKEEEWKSLKRFADYKPPEEEFLYEVKWAKNRIVLFMRRTGRTIELGRLVYHMKRRGQTVMETLREECPEHRASSWRALKPGYGRRAGMNQEQLRRVASKLQVPYYREMKTDEIRAMLILLAWKNGFVPGHRGELE